ncbi:reverse transcriptase domain-containing protein [Tanacetum coccineum]
MKGASQKLLASVKHALVLKQKCQKHIGLLIQREIPTWKWERIIMDSVTKLPKTSSGQDTIWVIVDRLIKSAHFIPTRETQIANGILTSLFFIINKEIVSRHGVSISIISDHDSLKNTNNLLYEMGRNLLRESGRMDIEFRRIFLTGIRSYTSRSHYQNVSKQTARESYKSPTMSLFDVGSSRVSIFIVNDITQMFWQNHKDNAKDS